MAEHIEREAAIAYIRKQSEECQKAFEELGGESGIYADAYNDLAEDFYTIPAADVAPVVRCRDCKHFRVYIGRDMCAKNVKLLGGREVGLCATGKDDFCNYGERKNDER